MSRKKKKNPNASNPNPEAASATNGGQAGEFVQRSLFDKMGESQLLIILKQILAALAQKIEKIEQALIDLLNRFLGGVPFSEREFYTPKEFAQIVELEPETVRQYLKEGRIDGKQSKPGRGGKLEWRISREELHRYQNDGLREPSWKYRHPK